MFRVLLIDDDLLFVEGLQLLLSELRDDIHFHQAKNSDEALSLMKSNDFDLIALDYYFRNADKQGFEAIKQISQNANNSKIVMISGVDIHTYKEINIETLTGYGLSGFISKSADHHELIESLGVVLKGESYFPDLMKSQRQEINEKQPCSSKLNRLTKRQRQILMYAADGIPNKVIADELGLSIGTVKAHLSTIYQLLEVKNRTQAAHIVKGYEIIH